MNAVLVTRYGGSEVLEYSTIEVASISEDEVLIKVMATSVNFADIKKRSGVYHSLQKPPYIPGIDVTGIVEAIGSKVKKVKVGDRVIAFANKGTYANIQRQRS